MVTTEKIQSLPLTSIRIDGGTQSRATISEETVSEYAAEMERGTQFPQVVVYFDGKQHWLSEGFHRFLARKRLKFLEIPCLVRHGTQRDAILNSAGSNSDHGLRRTREDKRSAVRMLLADQEWAQRSDKWIADQCRVWPDLVIDIRDPARLPEYKRSREAKERLRLEAAQVADPQPAPSHVIGKDGKKYPVRPKSRPKPQIDDDGKVVDASGTAVCDGTAHKAFLGLPLFDAIERLIADANCQVKALAEHDAGAWLPINRVANDLSNAKSAVRHSRPYVMHEPCDGEGCRDCKDSGYITEMIANNLSDQQRQPAGGAV